MTEDCLRLSTYFGERDRTARGLLADELLDLYATHDVRASILLRGAEGFGRLHRLRSDRLLSLSEDLPVVSMALDTRARIEALLEEVLAIKRRGLITLERASLLSSPAEAAPIADRFGAAAKLTIHVGRGQRVGGRPAFVEICELLHRSGMSGASVLLGVDGSIHGRRARARFFSRNAEVPMMIVAVGAVERVERVLPELERLLERPLITLASVRICKRDGEPRAIAPTLPATDNRGRPLWQKLTVHSSQEATHEGRPLHQEIVRRLRASDAAGATCLIGVWGFQGERGPRGDKLLQIRRQVPVVTVAIDTPEGAARSLAIIDEITGAHGLVTSETVPAMRAFSAHHELGSLELAEHGR